VGREVTRRPFEPLERSTISERVREEIHGRILAGDLHPGAPLPAERVLAEQFGVARTSIREAIQGLVAIGLIERKGNRSFVVEQVPGAELPGSDGGKRSLRTLLEAWRVIELCVAELAAVRATARERQEIVQMAAQPPQHTLEAFAAADREFHAAFAAACGNPVLAEVHGRVVDALLEAGDAAVTVLGGEGGVAVGDAVLEHQAIAAALRSGDTTATAAAVDRHLGGIHARIGRSSQRLSPAPMAPEQAARRTVGL
jgi:GntR family transcriptional repressor for pyruvate dehydrogenase complex